MVSVASPTASLTPGGASAYGGRGRRLAEDAALDVTSLMNGIREEVMALMLEGVQKTASFCASLCAAKIVRARRDYQRLFAEERRELERLYGHPSIKYSGSPARAHGLSSPSQLPRPHSLGSTSARGFLAGFAQENANAKSPAAQLNCDLHPDSYDSNFIGAYAAVQTLEEKTNMASRAMDLLDEALNVATEASNSRPSSARSARSNRSRDPSQPSVFQPDMRLHGANSASASIIHRSADLKEAAGDFASGTQKWTGKHTANSNAAAAGPAQGDANHAAQHGASGSENVKGSTRGEGETCSVGMSSAAWRTETAYPPRPSNASPSNQKSPNHIGDASGAQQRLNLFLPETM